MTKPTNAQAALQAASNVFAGSKAYASAETVTGLASMYKRWLDRQDREDAERWRKPDERPLVPVPAPRP